MQPENLTQDYINVQSENNKKHKTQSWYMTALRYIRLDFENHFQNIQGASADLQSFLKPNSCCNILN